MRKITNQEEYKAIVSRIDDLMEIVDDKTPSTDKNYIELDFFLKDTL